MSVSEHRTVSANQARQAILHCFKAKRPVMLHGSPGIGKSDLVAGIARELGGAMVDLRLPLMDITDLNGVPYYSKEDNLMKWAPPVRLPSQELADQFPLVVLFLDEINAAAPAVQASAYQLILNRAVGEYQLPDNVVVIAAGNKESDKGVTYRMPSPLANRFIHLEMRVDFDSWLDWATNNGVHADVVGYLSYAKSKLFDFDPKSSSRSFATPRTWSFVSELLEQESETSKSTLTDLVSGTVGEGLALDFMAHREIASSLPTPTDILTGKVHTIESKEGKEISAMYSLTIGLCYELKELYDQLYATEPEKWNEAGDRFVKFIYSNFNPELNILAMRIALKTYDLPFVPGKIPSYKDWSAKYGKHIIRAIGIN